MRAPRMTHRLSQFPIGSTERVARSLCPVNTWKSQSSIPNARFSTLPFAAGDRTRFSFVWYLFAKFTKFTKQLPHRWPSPSTLIERRPWLCSPRPSCYKGRSLGGPLNSLWQDLRYAFRVFIEGSRLHGRNHADARNRPRQLLHRGLVRLQLISDFRLIANHHDRHFRWNDISLGDPLNIGGPHRDYILHVIREERARQALRIHKMQLGNDRVRAYGVLQDK